MNCHNTNHHIIYGNCIQCVFFFIPRGFFQPKQSLFKSQIRVNQCCRPVSHPVSNNIFKYCLDSSRLLSPLYPRSRWLEVESVIFALRVAVFCPSSGPPSDLDPLFLLPLVWMDVNKLKAKRNGLRALCVKWPESNFHHMLSSGREVGLGASWHSSSLFPGAGPWLADCQGTDW